MILLLRVDIIKRFKYWARLIQNMNQDYKPSKRPTKLQIVLYALGAVAVAVVAAHYTVKLNHPQSIEIVNRPVETRYVLPTSINHRTSSYRSLVIPYNVDECELLREEHPEDYGSIMEKNLEDLRRRLSPDISAEMGMADFIKWEKTPEMKHPASRGKRNLVVIDGNSNVTQEQFQGSIDKIVQELCNPPSTGKLHEQSNGHSYGPMKLIYA